MSVLDHSLPGFDASARALRRVGPRVAISVLVAVLHVTGNIGRAEQQTFRGSTTAIVVDVVVRNAQAEPVTDLQLQDFELYEDGVKQEIADVGLVAPDAADSAFSAAARSGRGTGEANGIRSAPGAPAVGRTPADRSTYSDQPSIVALVFDRLSPEARALAYKGALAHLETSRENDYAGVFLSDLSLTTIQTYTNDRAAIARALRAVSSRATSQFDRHARRGIQDSSDAFGDSHPSVPEVAGAESPGRPPPRDGKSRDEAIFGAIDPQLNSWERLARDQQGYATTNALMALAATLGSLPGRKTIVFFAESLSIPDAVLPHFRNVVLTANRNNVSIYTIDAAGLRVHSKDAETGREVRGMGAAGIGGYSNLGVLERNEDVLRKDPRTSLSMLAEQTGGFLVENTNDLGRAFQRIDADRRFHYLLTYTPKNTTFNGEWRSIEVKVPGRKVTVRARSGYLAVHEPGAVPLLEYEAPVLAALAQAPAAQSMPVRSGAFVFPEPGGGARVAVLAAVHGQDLTFDEHGDKCRAELTMLARIRDERGEVVRKASFPYRLAGDRADGDAARQGQILFYRQPALEEPGRYMLEAAAHDVLGGRSGVARVPVVVPPANWGLRVGSLVLIRSAEPLKPEERDPANPLHLEDVVIYPSLGEPFRRGPEARLGFLLPMVAADRAAPAIQLELLSGERTLLAAPLTAGAPDEEGRIRQIGQLPLGSLSPGEYVLRLIVTSGAQREVREATFRLE